jgi:hypothetical protein
MVYGDDTVHVVMVTGFKYPDLCARSLKALEAISDEDMAKHATEKGYKGWDGKGKDKVERALTLADFQAARAELAESLSLSRDGENEATTDHVYDPLVVDGETVRGARVYKCIKDNTEGHVCKCRNCTGDERAPLPGTIYLNGLKIAEKVLTPAVNGPVPAAQSAPKSVAKNMLRKRLPIARFVAYVLEPGTNFMLAAGGTAAAKVTENGIVLSADILNVVNG